jgi:hypothetical protein
MNRARLGHFSGNKHAFFFAVFSSDSQHILAYTYTGALSVWRRVQSTEGAGERYVSIGGVPTGHYAQATDLDWSTAQDFLVSCSHD